MRWSRTYVDTPCCREVLVPVILLCVRVVETGSEDNGGLHTGKNTPGEVITMVSHNFIDVLLSVSIQDGHQGFSAGRHSSLNFSCKMSSTREIGFNADVVRS